MKTGTNVTRQREWLQRRALPHVLVRCTGGVGDSMYMERLFPLALSEYLDQDTMRDIVVTRLEALWSLPVESTFDYDAHAGKVHGLLRAFSLPRDRVVGAMRDIPWPKLRTGLTHGDPTFENVMVRLEGDPVLIDPVPSCPAVPDLVCVDVGKVIQSVEGWERFRYCGVWDHPPTGVGLRSFTDIGVTLTNADAYAAQYWHVVHLLRTLPYLSDRLVNDARERVASYARLL